MSSLLGLAGRCESAAEPSDVLDGLIEAELHIAFDLDVSQFVGGVPIEWEADEDDGRVSVYIGKRKFKRYRAPAYTASLDAAMTLVPEGWRPVIDLASEEGAALVDVWALPLASPKPRRRHVKAATPALALCAAALKARAASGMEAPSGGETVEQGSTEGDSPIANGETPPPSDLSTDKDG